LSASTPNKPIDASPAQTGDQLAQVDPAVLLQELGKVEARLESIRHELNHTQRLTTLGTIATIIAHEYNNILTPVMSYAQMALARPNDVGLAHKALQKALAGSEKAASISSSLLGFAREGEKRQDQFAKLSQAIEQSLACLARDPEKDGIALSVDVPDIAVAMGPVALQQVLINILLNAVKAMRDSGGRLMVSGRAAGDLLSLEIADTGPGIPEAIRDRLFEPFVTAKTRDVVPGEPSFDEPAGTGLGLCICRDLVEQVGGKIAFETATGQGTTFRLDLPIATAR